MCSNENAAPHAVHYLNAQLAALYENAKKCLEEHESAHTEEERRSYALAEFRVYKPGTSDQSFSTAFDKLELGFICDHDALLQITLLNPVMLDTRPGRLGQFAELPEVLRLTYRVAFETRNIIGADTKIGDTSATIPLLILALKGAQLVSAEPEVTVGRALLLKHIAEYLQLLHEAGNHVLFSLPDFDSVRPTPPSIDFSLMSRGPQLYVGDLFGFPIEQINIYIASIWLKSASLGIEDLGEFEDLEDTRAIEGVQTSTDLATSRDVRAIAEVAIADVDWRLRCLAEFNSASLGARAEYGNFKILFGPPRVEALCSKEVIVYFNILELEMFDDLYPADPPHQYMDWTVAMVVDVVYTTEADGRVVNIAFDLKHARYHHLASGYPGLEEDDHWARERWTLLVSFFQTEYLHILERTGYHVIFSRDTRWDKLPGVPHDEAGDGSWWTLEKTAKSGTESRAPVQHAKMFSFDHVIAISQASINAQLETLSEDIKSIFSRWSYYEYFAASFKPLSLRLLSNNRAIVWVHLRGGHFKKLTKKWKPDNESPKYEFGDCRLAFEVELKMCSEEHLEGRYSETYRKTLAYQKHGNLQDRKLNHIYLNLRRAEYLPEYSTFGELSVGMGKSSMLHKLQAVVFYLTRRYFPAICRQAQHVISSVPVWTERKSLPSYALTSVRFHVYSKVEVTRHNWAHITPGLEPLLTVVGMTGFNTLEANQLDYSTGWIAHGQRGLSHGTIGIAKRVFIEERLFHLVERINALTTLIPTTPDVYKGFTALELKTWANHVDRRERPSKWELVPSTGDGVLRYIWEHTEEWSHNLRGNNLLSAMHGVSCITRNYVELPTAINQGIMSIKINGSVELSFSLQTTELHKASSKVQWSTHVTLETVGSGIKVHTRESKHPFFADTEYTGNGSAFMLPNPEQMLRGTFPAQVDLEDLVNEINAFEGAWQYCFPLASSYTLANPIFNDEGDLLFELCRGGSTHSHLLSPSSAQGSRTLASRRSMPRIPSGMSARSSRGFSPSLSSRPLSPAITWHERSEQSISIGGAADGISPGNGVEAPANGSATPTNGAVDGGANGNANGQAIATTAPDANGSAKTKASADASGVAGENGSAKAQPKATEPMGSSPSPAAVDAMSSFA